MGLPSRQPIHARHRDGPHRRDDRREAQVQHHGRGRRPASGLIPALCRLAALAGAGLAGAGLAPAGPAAARDAAAETLRVATWNAGLTREGPGLLLRDILSGSDPQIAAAARVIAAADPDILLLTGVDYDRRLAALSAFAAVLRAGGADYPYLFAFRPNTGSMTALDLDGDGRLRGPGDAQGWGRFAGAGGMALLSRLPIDTGGARDFSGLLWADLPGALAGGVPQSDLAIRRLSTTGHWDVPVLLPEGGRLSLLAWYATPPVFGRGDENARRNHDEAAFWRLLLDGALPFPPPDAPFVILGDANLDPADGAGMSGALDALLSDPRLSDPRPASAG
ncbi:MAG: endonuclease/exonuclease/phosphatase family protein, partial [Thermoleophilia bacterium]|nr:endonuclease/exonuclease/phosphatase family protein [Thermoleophilia bacterium]